MFRYATGVLMLAAAVPVLAQQTPAQLGGPDPALQEVVVTGSHIKRAAGEVVDNIQIISAQEILSSGQETLADYLRTVSATFGNNYNESFSNSFAPGAAMIGLRGLSGKDTLVLLNGRRITNYGLFQNLSDAFVDLNVIPLAAIDHIEILKSGGSAIYGSDAVAGVINIILKQNTTDKTIEVGGRLTTDGGGASRDANASFGFGNFAADGYNVFATASILKRDQLLFSQRSNTEDQNYTGLPDGDLQYHIANQYVTANPGPFPSCGTNGLPGVVAANGIYGPACYFNDAGQLPLMPGTERINFTSTANLRLSDNWTAYGDLFFSNEETWNYFSPQSFNSGSFVLNPATGGVTTVSNVLPGNNPASLNGQPTTINYGFQSVGGRNEQVVSDTYRVSLGAKGTWLGWDLDANYGHSENHVSLYDNNFINAQNLMADIADGAFDFLDPALTPAANTALRVSNDQFAVAKLDTLDLDGSGSLFDLPGGAAKVALGIELRHESADDQPGAAAAAGEVMSSGVTTVVGHRYVYAGYGEFDFPILKSLELDLAGRGEHYTDVGNTFRPQETLRWQPLHELTLRAVYADGFRAPSLAEASSSSSLSIEETYDPLDPEHRTQEDVGAITVGNPNVKPETSKNLDLGIAFSPANFDLSADYYNIRINNVIAPNANATDIIDDPSAYPPGSLVRSANGTAVYVEALYINQFAIRTSGVDLDASVNFALAGGTLKFAADATSVFSLEVEQGGAWSQFVGSNGWNYLSPISGGGPVTRWKGSLSAGWNNQDWAASATLRYTEGYQNVGDSNLPPGETRVGSFEPVDLAIQYRALAHVRISLSVVNLFNRYPPYDSAALLYFTGTPYDPTTYDDEGRMVDLHVKYMF